MPDIIQGSFKGGAVSPRIANQIGTELHHSSVAGAVNWQVTPQGSIIARGGTQYADDSLNPTRYKHLTAFPTTTRSGLNYVFEIDSNGLTGVDHEGSLYVWLETFRTIVGTIVPEEFGSLRGLYSFWSASTESVILVSPFHQPYELKFNIPLDDYELTPLFTSMPADWTIDNGFPKTACFFQDRLWFGGVALFPNKLWATPVGDIHTIVPTPPVITAVDDDFLQCQCTCEPATTPPTSKPRCSCNVCIMMKTGDINVNAGISIADIILAQVEPLEFKMLLNGYIQWIVASGSRLLIGTSTDEYNLGSVDGQGVTAQNSVVSRSSSHGSSEVSAIPVDDQVFFVSPAGARLLATNYVRDNNNWIAEEVSFKAQHLFRDRQHAIVKVVDSPTPDTAVYVLRADGKVACCTYNKAENTKAWTLLDFSGKVVDITVTTNRIKGSYLYLMIERGTQKSVEILRPQRTDWFRADSWEEAYIKNEPDGFYAKDLERFEGMYVDVGSEYGALVVNALVVNAQVKLAFAPVLGSTDLVGIHIENEMQTLRPSMGQIKDTMIGSKITLKNTTVVVFDSISPVVDNQKPSDVSSEQIMGSRDLNFSYFNPRGFETAISELRYDVSGWGKAGSLTISAGEPFICEITGIASQVKSNRI